MGNVVSEKAVQEFWTDYPMIFYGKDIHNSSPEDIFKFMEQVFRNKTPHLQTDGQPLLSNIIDYTSLKGKKVLEIGYGTGWLLNEFVQAGSEVHGIDLSRSHYELAKYRFETEGLDLRVASAEDIPYPDGCFDMVVSWGVLHHASDDQKCYDEVYRVLKPGGHCFLMLYRKGGVKYYYHKLFKQGILRGGLFKYGLNPEKFITAITDVHYDGSPGAPLSRHYRRNDLKNVFSKFTQIVIKITGSWAEFNGLPAGRLPLSDWFLSKNMRTRLLSWFGGFWIINLVK